MQGYAHAHVAPRTRIESQDGINSMEFPAQHTIRRHEAQQSSYFDINSNSYNNERPLAEPGSGPLAPGTFSTTHIPLVTYEQDSIPSTLEQQLAMQQHPNTGCPASYTMRPEHSRKRNSTAQSSPRTRKQNRTVVWPSQHVSLSENELRVDGAALHLRKNEVTQSQHLHTSNSPHIPQRNPSMLRKGSSNVSGLLKSPLYAEVPSTTSPRDQASLHHHHRLPVYEDPDPTRLADSLSRSREAASPSVVDRLDMPSPAAKPKAAKSRFTRKDDERLVELKETKDLTWKQIAAFFPGRTPGTLQVRYCTKLKSKTEVWSDNMVSSVSLFI